MGDEKLAMRRKLAALLIVLMVSVLLLVPVQGADTSTSQYTIALSATNTGGAVTDIQMPFNLSSGNLIDGNFIEPDALNTVVQEGSTEIPSMPAMDRTALLGAVQDDGGVLTDETIGANSGAADDITLLPASPTIDDAYYFGGDTPWQILTITVTQAGVGTWTLTWEYWDGTAWSGLIDLDDRTQAFTKLGTSAVQWTRQSDWEITSFDSISAYWVRARVSAVSAITVQPLGGQAWYENGEWWSYIASLGLSEQKNFNLFIGGSADFILDHTLFLGPGGATTPDDASIELGNNFVIQMVGFFDTTFASPTRDYIFKDDAIHLRPTADGELTLTITTGAGSTDLVVSSVPTGVHTITVLSDTTTIRLDVDGAFSDSAPSIVINDNSNEWAWSTNGSSVYLTSVRITFPTANIFDTESEWDTGATHTGTDATPAGNLELALSSGVPADWSPPGSDSGIPEACLIQYADYVGSGADCRFPEIFSPATVPTFADTGSFSFRQNLTGGVITEDRAGGIYQEFSVSGGEVWSATARILNNQNPTGQWDYHMHLLLEWFNASSTLIGYDFQCKGRNLGTQPEQFDGSAQGCTFEFLQNTWFDLSVETITAPVGATTLRVWVYSRCQGNACDQADNLFFDTVMVCECNVAPTFPDNQNVLSNPGFESLFSSPGNWISPTINPTATSVDFATISWTVTDPLETTTLVEVSLDNQATWTIATSGADVPGISIGQDISALNINLRITYTSEGPNTPSMNFVFLLIADSTDRQLFYQLNTVPTIILIDRSGNGNDGRMYFPEKPSLILGATGPLQSITTVASLTQETGNPDFIGEIEATDVARPSSDSSIGVPGLFLFQMLSDITDNEIPVEAFLIVGAIAAVAAIGMVVMVATQSLTVTIIAMAFVITVFVNIGTNGIFPTWLMILFLFFSVGISAVGRRLP